MNFSCLSVSSVLRLVRLGVCMSRSNYLMGIIMKVVCSPISVRHTSRKQWSGDTDKSEVRYASTPLERCPKSSFSSFMSGMVRHSIISTVFMIDLKVCKVTSV
jgi:hypothetical protein